MNEKKFYKMLSEIHNAVADMSDGCMGCNFTTKRVEKEDKNKTVYEYGSDKTPLPFSYVKSDKTLDYIGNIIRKYIKISKIK